MAMSILAFRHAVAKVEPQALRLHSDYYDAQVAISPNALDRDVEQVCAELPAVLNGMVGGSPNQFGCYTFTCDGYHMLNISREPELDNWEEDPRLQRRLDRASYEAIEDLFRPRYQGAVCAEVSIRRKHDHHLQLKLVRWFGRWRLSSCDLGHNFPSLMHLSLSGGSRDEIQFCVSDQLTNEGILSLFQRIAAYLDLYLPRYVRLHDPEGRIPRQALTEASQTGHYRQAIDATRQ